MVIRDLLPNFPRLRVVLMSATMNADLFSRYFHGAPVITIPGRTFPVRDLYLEHALELTQHVVQRGADWARRGKGGVVMAMSKEQEQQQRAGPVTDRDDELLTAAELAVRYHETCSAVALQALQALDHDAIDFALIVDLVVWFVRQRQLRAGGPADVVSATRAVLDEESLFWGAEPDTESVPVPPPVKSGASAGAALRGRGPGRPDARRGAAAAVAASADADASSINAIAQGLDGAILIFLPGLKEITTLYVASGLLGLE